MLYFFHTVSFLIPSQSLMVIFYLVMMVSTIQKNASSKGYYWPSMNADIGAYLKACHCCQVHQQDQCQPPALLSPMLQTTKHNQHIHADLFGPLKTSDNDEEFIFITVGLFKCWLCHFGVPLNLITDQGTEFCKKNLAKIFFNGWALHT